MSSSLQALPAIFVVTAPSGTGKTTLNRRLIQEIPNLEISVSHTTRVKRAQEIHGDHYWFISVSEFEKEIKEERMLEWANVFGNYYGTSQGEITRILDKGSKVLLEIDVQGWEQIQKKIANAIGVFILPPSMKVLWQRLADRGTDSFESRLKRIKTARLELDYAKNYHHFIVNDHLDHAFSELKNLIHTQTSGNLSFEDGIKFVENLKTEYDSDLEFKKLML